MKLHSSLTERLGCRNRALVLLGFDSACRRSELEALDVEDVAFTHDGIVLTLRRSKTDQAAVGRQIGIPYRSNLAMCTVRAMRDWIEAAGISSGALFRETGPGGELIAPYVDVLGRPAWGAAAGQVDCSSGEGGSHGGGAGPGQVRRPQPAGRLCCGAGRCRRAVDHAADRPQVSPDGEALYPPGKPVQRQRGGRHQLMMAGRCL